MFFDTYCEFIEALYYVKYSTLDEEEKIKIYNNIYQEYREYNHYNKDFEQIYSDIINNIICEISQEEYLYLSRYNGLLLSINQLISLKIKIHYLDYSSYIKRVFCVEQKDKKYHCLQCDNKVQSNFFTFIYNKKEVVYCKRCVKFGRADNRVPKFYINIPLENIKIKKPDVELSFEQKKASCSLVENLKQNKNTLVWAVCGAGKTEIVYETVYRTINENKTLCFAVPRKDVEKELAIRFRRDFKELAINVLHGDEKILTGSKIYIMTTHQLMKYYNYFDVVIIDEVDAFPYYGDSLLEEGVLTGLKENSSLIFLSATPSKKIKRFVDEIIKIPIRYHKHLLPIPKVKIEKNNVFILEELSKNLKDFILESLKNKRKILIFVPAIAMCENLVNYIKLLLEDDSIFINSVHSEDKKRSEKIADFYSNKTNILVTTTVLERGVTFDYLDIAVFDASHSHFTKEALIQISGRVGRKEYDNSGKIIFLTDKVTKNINSAIKEIKYMNALAKQKKLNIKK
ncbi:competence protein [Gemella sp. oral taxon 928]|uniref:DEAD/DEAH box helicase n=1 Tax=Gemella sp. oral taxon 928 TaxID=1785995 RepID=UPI000767F871|nr:DEAD/DEAH box helicase [Gemella sp. oral taxon 928]AME10063.1 competence protein [Gemella sp. oral taxon 928]